MIAARYETYQALHQQLPFVLNTDLQRSTTNFSREPNWHDNIEIQLCTAGQGVVLLNGQRYDFFKDDVVIVNSNVIHYTCTDSSLTYSCLIVSTDFCRQMGIDYDQISFSPQVRDPRITQLFLQMLHIYSNPDLPLRIAQLNKLLLELLIAMGTDHAIQNPSPSVGKVFDAIKAALTFIHENYIRKLTLDDISRAAAYDKFALCREFKKITGQTVFENLNRYRCLRAAEQIQSGYSVSEAALRCGFENLSFFTKTFKKYMGTLPSRYKAPQKTQ